MADKITIKIPLQCVNCGYPKQYGTKVYAEIIAKQSDVITRKEWSCPECKCKKTFEVDLGAYEKERYSFFPINKPKTFEELKPGQVGRMPDD